MSRFVGLLAVLLVACEASPVIFPDPSAPDGGQGGNSSAASSSASTTSSTSTTTASSGAGGSGGAAPGGGSSGSRLRRQFVTSTDGLSATVPGVFYDTVTGKVCNSITTPQGNRCMNLNMISQYYFTDAACSLAALVLPKTCAPPLYAFTLESTLGQCATVTTFRAYTTGALVPTMYQKSGANCVEVPVAQQATLDAYAMGAEVDYSGFALLTTEIE